VSKREPARREPARRTELDDAQPEVIAEVQRRWAKPILARVALDHPNEQPKRRDLLHRVGGEK
jgi:hypothetical protein